MTQTHPHNPQVYLPTTIYVRFTIDDALLLRLAVDDVSNNSFEQSDRPRVPYCFSVIGLDLISSPSRLGAARFVVLMMAKSRRKMKTKPK